MGRDETTRTATLRPTSFNPRARAGRDLLKSFIHDLTSTFQSTRPRGARPRMSVCRYRTTGFNPRARVGRDTLELMHAQVEAEFQSTRPRGARLVQLAADADDSQFQSTRPRGARRFGLSRIQRSDRFQSTRPRGARRGAHPGGNGRTEFQSTRPRGARLLIEARCLSSDSFNPRARVGRDCLLTGQIPTIRQSNLTSKPQQS